jgi:hypothetical protein
MNEYMNFNFETDFETNIPKAFEKLQEELSSKPLSAEEVHDAFFNRVYIGIAKTFETFKKRNPSLADDDNIVRMQTRLLRNTETYFSKQQLNELSCLFTKLSIYYCYHSQLQRINELIEIM